MARLAPHDFARRWESAVRGDRGVAGCRNYFQKSALQLYCPLPKKGQRHPSQHGHLDLTMRTALLLRQARMHFPRLDVDQIKIRPIEKGGSDRKFYRINCGADPAAAGLILVKYNLEREENRHYVEIAQFLRKHGIRVPEIYFHDPAEGLIWIEDLG